MENQVINNLLVARTLRSIKQGDHTRSEIETTVKRMCPKTNIQGLDIDDVDVIINYLVNEGFLREKTIKDKSVYPHEEVTVYEKTRNGWLFTS